MRRLPLLFLLAFALSTVASAQALRTRQPIPKAPIVAAPLPADPRGVLERRLIVKFADGLRVRARADGGITSLAGRDLAAVEALAATLAARFEPAIRLSESLLGDLESRAAVRSGIGQPDLAATLEVLLPESGEAALEAAANAFQALGEVEFAYLQTLGVPPPTDIPPTTPNLVSNQTYRGPNPGVDADFAWSQGLRGAGVRLSDCEYGWNAAHEDLNDINIHPEPGQTVDPSVASFGWDEHGTAVLGETSSVDNGYGCSGIAPDASVYTYTEWSVQEGLRRLTAITHAIADSGIGDVVLLEMQTGSGGPAEADTPVWMVCKVGTDAGVVVVGAAGNGNQNLDSPGYASYMALGDSGAIIVGAGSSNTSHSKLGFSTFGSRVNVQGWGENVFTIGYGNFAQYGGDGNQAYTSTFGGTSSASPFVAAACLTLQGLAKTNCGSPLSSQELRALLIATGIPQGAGGHIGPFVSLPNALAAFPASAFTSFCAGDGSATACPCSNTGATCRGCANSVGTAGARLVASGVADVTSDSLVLRCDGMPSSATSFYIQGSVQAAGGLGILFGDGLLCLSGTLTRLGPKTNADGRSSWGAPAGDMPISVIGMIPAGGGTFYYQTWYRDTASFCTPDTFNVSNGLSVVWSP